MVPVTSFGANGITRKCPTCGAFLEEVIDEQLIHQPAQPAQPAQPQVKPKARPAAKVKKYNVVKEAKAQERFLAREIKRLKKDLKAAEKEHGELTRLLNAANEKPTNLRALKAV